MVHRFEKRRYTPTLKQSKLLGALVECGRHAISRRINETNDGDYPWTDGSDGTHGWAQWKKLHDPPISRPASCSAHEVMPAREGDEAGRICFRRQARVGGLEMSANDLSRSTRVVQGWCSISAHKNKHLRRPYG